MRAEPRHGLGKAQGRLEVWGQWKERQGVPTGARLGARTSAALDNTTEDSQGSPVHRPYSLRRTPSGGRKSVSVSTAAGRYPSLSLPASGGSGVPWLVATSLQPVPLSAPGLSLVCF